jgi:hypothetical protein
VPPEIIEGRKGKVNRHDVGGGKARGWRLGLKTGVRSQESEATRGVGVAQTSLLRSAAFLESGEFTSPRKMAA